MSQSEVVNKNGRVYPEGSQEALQGIGMKIEATPPKHYLNLTLNPNSFGIGIRGVKTSEGVQVESVSIIDLPE